MIGRPVLIIIIDVVHYTFHIRVFIIHTLLPTTSYLVTQAITQSGMSGFAY